MAKSNSIKKLRKEADKIFQQRCMDSELCELCGKQAYCCHHIIAKSLSNRLRYELRNSIKVCMGCHNWIHSRADPAIFQKIRKVKGKKIMNWLEKTRREPVKINKQYYENVIINLQNDNRIRERNNGKQEC